MAGEGHVAGLVYWEHGVVGWRVRVDAVGRGVFFGDVEVGPVGGVVVSYWLAGGEVVELWQGVRLWDVEHGLDRLTVAL